MNEKLKLTINKLSNELLYDGEVYWLTTQEGVSYEKATELERNGFDNPNDAYAYLAWLSYRRNQSEIDQKESKVYLVLNRAGIIFGAFDSEEKAQRYVGVRELEFEIRKMEVL